MNVPFVHKSFLKVEKIWHVCKAQYRELTKYEYDQINNSDSPVGGNLEKDGFKTIAPTRIFELDEYEANETNKQTHNLYKIDKEKAYSNIALDEELKNRKQL